jgi:PAS domain S-box-containing protein
MPDFIFVKDTECRFVTANTAVAELMGTTKGELIGKTGFYYPKELAEKFYADEQEVMRSGRAIVQREEENRDAEGKHIYISTTKVPLTDSNGKIVGIVGIGRDITKRKEAEKESIILEKQLQQSKKMEAIGTLSAGIAHEINTPMQFIGDNTRFLSEVINNLVGLIGTYRDLLKECGPGDRVSPVVKKGLEAEREVDLEYLEEEIPKAITQTQEGLAHVTKIINAMKNFSRMDTEEKTKADINKAVESAVTVSRNEWKYVADVKTDLDPALPPVPCFLSDINQVVMNLIINAAHAIADTGGGRGKAKGLITITTRRKNDDVIITVSDTGTGIPEDIRDKIFEHFFTTKDVGKGTGQGLSMAYSAIVEKHGGKLTFDTEMGKGTTFIIQLPIFTNRQEDRTTDQKGRQANEGNE